MDKKQKEALIIALAEKGKTYREITKEAGVSPNTIKAVLNRTGLDETTSTSSRAFELFSEGKTPLQVAIALSLEADEAIKYHQEYYMLLGCTEFTKVYLRIKDNPWPYVNLAKLAQNSGMNDGEVAEILKIANGYLPWIKLEYDRLQGELNSWKEELRNTVRIYQDFCDRNLKLKKREDELQLTINELEGKVAELQVRFTKALPELQEYNKENTNVDQIKVMTNDVFIPQPIMAFNSYQNDNEMHTQTKPSSTTIIFDTKDLF